MKWKPTWPWRKARPQQVDERAEAEALVQRRIAELADDLVYASGLAVVAMEKSAVEVESREGNSTPEDVAGWLDAAAKRLRTVLTALFGNGPMVTRGERLDRMCVAASNLIASTEELEDGRVAIDPSAYGLFLYLYTIERELRGED